MVPRVVNLLMGCTTPISELEFPQLFLLTFVTCYMSRNINGNCSLEIRAGIPIAVIGNWYIMVGGREGGL